MYAHSDFRIFRCLRGLESNRERLLVKGVFGGIGATHESFLFNYMNREHTKESEL